MTIQEAIRSGKPFRRIGHNGKFEWITSIDIHMKLGQLEVKDLLAEDWEIKKDPLEFLIGIGRDGKLSVHPYSAFITTDNPLQRIIRVREVVE